MAWRYKGMAYGHLASKANSRQKTNWGGVIKSDAAFEFINDFQRQIRREKLPFEGPVKLTVIVFYKDNRRDLDVSLLQDCIQERGIIKNDRQIKQIDALRKVDRKAPRVLFMLDELTDYTEN